MSENLLDHSRVFDALGDDPQCPAAGRAGLDVDAKYTLLPLRPSHLVPALFGRLLLAAQQTNNEPTVNGSCGSLPPSRLLILNGRKQYAGVTRSVPAP